MTEGSEFSATPVTDDQLVAWPRVAAIAVMVAFALPVFVAGLEIYQGLSFVDTMIALVIGSVVLTVIGASGADCLWRQGRGGGQSCVCGIAYWLVWGEH
jgi:purine-cytosine permease-like protein